MSDFLAPALPEYNAGVFNKFGGDWSSMGESRPCRGRTRLRVRFACVGRLISAVQCFKRPLVGDALYTFLQTKGAA